MVRIFKTTNFAKQAKKEKVIDSALLSAIQEIEKGLIDANLGGGLLKKRVARQGKRGGHRTLIAFKNTNRAVFIFGFSKNNRDNLENDEEKIYKELAQYYLELTPEQLRYLIDHKKLHEVRYGKNR